jgi:Fur family peroxide stress response transcriptional regulator
MGPEIKYSSFKELCQSRGLKATSQRFIIYKMLAASCHHPTADQLLRQVASSLPGLGRDTVYRALNLLVDYGLAFKLSLPGGAARFDGDPRPHHHFYCSVCGAVADFQWPAFAALAWPAEVAALGRPRLATAVIVGQCRTCSLPLADSA